MKLIALFVALLCALSSKGQETVIERPHYANLLAGKVVDPNGDPIPNALIQAGGCSARGELIDASVRKTAKSKEDGAFDLGEWKQHSNTCLSVSAAGFRIHQFRVKYRANGGTLVVALSVAN